jgi:hypothetical protein
MFFVQTVFPGPYSTSFARVIASSTSRKRVTARTGPKTSSWGTREPGRTSSMIVGAR